MRLVAARDITVADLPYISNPFFAKNDVRDAYCGGFTSIHNLNEFVPVQWRHYQQGLDELLKKIDKMEVCLVYSMKLPFLGVVYWQQDPDYPNNPQKGRWVASLSGINQYANLQGIVSSAYSKSMVPQTHSQQSSLQSSTAKAVVNQGFESRTEGSRRKFLGQKQVTARPEEAERGDHVLQEATAFKQTDFASTYSIRLSQTPAETNDVVGTALTAGGLRSGLGLSRGAVVSSAGGRVVPNPKVNLYSAAPGPVNFMKGSDRFYLNASKRPDVDPDGYFDVVAHGSPNKIQIETPNGPELVDHRTASRLIEQQPGYNGQNIRLFSCSTGACDTGFAQNLANKLNVEVQAPTDLLWAYPNGKTLVAPKAPNGQPNLNSLGEIKTFLPKKSQ